MFAWLASREKMPSPHQIWCIVSVLQFSRRRWKQGPRTHWASHAYAHTCTASLGTSIQKPPYGGDSAKVLTSGLTLYFPTPMSSSVLPSAPWVHKNTGVFVGWGVSLLVRQFPSGQHSSNTHLVPFHGVKWNTGEPVPLFFGLLLTQS